MMKFRKRKENDRGEKKDKTCVKSMHRYPTHKKKYDAMYSRNSCYPLRKRKMYVCMKTYRKDDGSLPIR